MATLSRDLLPRTEGVQGRGRRDGAGWSTAAGSSSHSNVDANALEDSWRATLGNAGRRATIRSPRKERDRESNLAGQAARQARERIARIAAKRRISTATPRRQGTAPLGQSSTLLVESAPSTHARRCGATRRRGRPRGADHRLLQRPPGRQDSVPPRALYEWQFRAGGTLLRHRPLIPPSARVSSTRVNGTSRFSWTSTRK
jgi:hypothetical protein